MRGVVSAGMVAALEQLGFRDSFDVVYGSSAGSICGAYFLAKQARYGTTIFYENINNSNFIDLLRIFKGEPIVSLEYLLDIVSVHEKPLDCRAVIESDIQLKIVASSIREKRSTILEKFNTPEELRVALKASARIPIVAGPPVEYKGDRYLDASVYESIPFRAALQENPTDVVVLMSRPHGDMRSDPGFLDKYVISRRLAKIDRELAEHYMERAVEYKSEVQVISSGSDEAGSAKIWPIQIASDSKKVSSLEKSRSKLVRGAMDGYEAVYSALGENKPQLVEIIMPFNV